MKGEKWHTALRWLAYYGLLLLFYCLQTTPGFFSIAGIKPVFVLPLAVCVCMFEEVIPAACFSMTAGFLWDISSDQLFGFNALIFFCCGAAISLLCIYYFHSKMPNSLLFGAAVLLIQNGMDLVFGYLMWGVQGSGMIFLTQMLPTTGYTMLFFPPVFYLIRKVSGGREDLTGA